MWHEDPNRCDVVGLPIASGLDDREPVSDERDDPVVWGSLRDD